MNSPTSSAFPLTVSEAGLLRDGFGEAPKFRVLMAEWDGQPAGYALFFDYYSSFEGRPGLFLEDIYVRDAPSGKGNWQGAAGPSGVGGARKELLWRALAGAGLEYSGDRLLQEPGRHFSGRLENCEPGRGRAGTCGKGGAMTTAVKVIGAGLAGSEAAWQCARRGIAVELWEMRPVALDTGASDRGFCGTGLLELAEVRQREHSALAAERRNAAGRIAAAGDRARVRRPRRTCAGG